MKKLLALLLCAALLPAAACAENETPRSAREEVPAASFTEQYGLEVADGAVTGIDDGDWLLFRSMDFGSDGAVLRIKAAAETRLEIKIYRDTLEGSPYATAVFTPITKEFRLRTGLEGVHDLYFVLSGDGVFTSWQVFSTVEDIEAAIREERGTVYEDSVPSRYTRKCANGGAVQRFTYQAHDYFNDAETTYEKAAYVYLPCNYDPNETYDLLILCHGIGGSEAEWGMTGEGSRVKMILDNLIDQGEIRPMIVVTPNGRAGVTSDYGSFYLFDRELRNDLLPALAEAFAVDITDRERCAMAGLSMGGMQTINLGIGQCLDLFSAFGAFSAAPTTDVAAKIAANLNAHPELPVRMFYNICGTEDSVAYASAAGAADRLLPLTKQLNDDNFIVQYVPGGHDFGVWYLGFYNFVRLIGEIPEK